MGTFSPEEAFVALSTRYSDERETLDWAQSYAQECPELNPESSLFDLLRINRKRKDEVSNVCGFMERFLSEIDPEFNPRAKEFQAVARTLFERRLRQYLADQCSPWEVCRMVSPIEQLYDFPDWLGDMYNACDWIEPNAKPVDCRHLQRAIEAHLSAA